ncbi:MAG: hypothetical protein H6557_02390 [Lewinellaceae bacterium]|nr:hypothetical protein [Phaeodactylibacter sp.]MCB9035447.1 hypothetical protein [Lewinellaceae bacterium]
MDFTLDKKDLFLVISGFFLLIILLLTKSVEDELSTSIVLSAGPSENIEEIIDQVSSELQQYHQNNKLT